MSWCGEKMCYAMSSVMYWQNLSRCSYNFLWDIACLQVQMRSGASSSDRLLECCKVLFVAPGIISYNQTKAVQVPMLECPVWIQKLSCSDLLIHTLQSLHLEGTCIVCIPFLTRRALPDESQPRPIGVNDLFGIAHTAGWNRIRR